MVFLSRQSPAGLRTIVIVCYMILIAVFVIGVVRLDHRLDEQERHIESQIDNDTIMFANADVVLDNSIKQLDHQVDVLKKRLDAIPKPAKTAD